MSFTFKVNTAFALTSIRRLKISLTEIQPAMNRGGLFFIGMIQEKWYSGRRGDDTGLNVRTGRLRESWFPMVQAVGNDTVLQVNTDVNYAKKHEKGINTPKRTDIEKDWETEGKKMIRDEILEIF